MKAAGAIRIINACRSRDALNQAWARIGQIAWSGPAVRQAYETRRAELARASIPPIDPAYEAREASEEALSKPGQRG